MRPIFKTLKLYLFVKILICESIHLIILLINCFMFSKLISFIIITLCSNYVIRAGFLLFCNCFLQIYLLYTVWFLYHRKYTYGFNYHRNCILIYLYFCEDLTNRKLLLRKFIIPISDVLYFQNFLLRHFA